MIAEILAGVFFGTTVLFGATTRRAQKESNEEGKRANNLLGQAVDLRRKVNMLESELEQKKQPKTTKKSAKSTKSTKTKK